MGDPQHLNIVRRVGALLAAPLHTDNPVNAYTSQLIASLRASPEGRGGVTAFLEKRKPKWAEQ